jgi:hypothetical protein
MTDFTTQEMPSGQVAVLDREGALVVACRDQEAADRCVQGFWMMEISLGGPVTVGTVKATHE